MNARHARPPKLFKRAYWHPETPGGGLHLAWGKEDGDDKRWTDQDGNPHERVGWGGIDYAALRKKVVDAFVPLQQKNAAPMVLFVQELQDRAYRVSPLFCPRPLFCPQL